ncbi:MAG: heavy metal translocating P-type ATPase [Clostridia bacterium]|nr:heavy metal translocating P-type ATPase [Clostridia bacterium]
MSQAVKRELLLEGLNCSSCSLKIEEKVRKIEGVRSASLDFVSKKMSIELLKKEDGSRIVEEASRIAKSVESGIKVVDSNGMAGENKNQEMQAFISKSDIVRLFSGAFLLAAALLAGLNSTVQLVLYASAYVILGGEVLLSALRNIAKGRVFDENFLMSIATIGAFVIGEYPEGVSVMLFYQIGEMFQDMAVNRSRKSIKSLLDIRPDYANLKAGEEIRRVMPYEVKVGERVVVKPGERIPLDGRIVEGKSMVDTSALTGESLPREVEPGSEVLAGFINSNGLLVVEVEKNFSESTVSRILELVQNAAGRKAPAENFITRFARYYTPAVVAAAALTAILPPLLVQGQLFSEWLYRALIFLVISCPCALVVSIPLSFFGGIGGASRKGILIKGSNYLDALNNIDTVVFDKTGTLTKGVFSVAAVKPKEGMSKQELLEFAAAAESYSNHPVAVSILKAYGGKFESNSVRYYNEIIGHGVAAKYGAREILAGNKKLMEKENIVIDESPQDSGGSVVHIAVDKQYAGYILISDELKEDSRKTVQVLKSVGVRKTVMLTGDGRPSAEKAAAEAGVDEVYAGLLPHEKVDKLEMFEKEKKGNGKLVFVGDGINDAPVLARADIGIAMGGLGSDAAIETADIVLMTDEPSKLVEAIRIARKTRNIVWQNILFALGVKVIVLALGAGGIATMWEAVFADVGVALLAVLNAMRVMK